MATALTQGAIQTTGPDEVRVSSRPYFPQAVHAIRVETRLVEVRVVVRDAHGRAVSGLQQTNFTILDEGKARPITAFTEDTAIPSAGLTTGSSTPYSARRAGDPLSNRDRAMHATRSIALFFDDVHLQPGDLRHAQLAAERFVREALAPGDRMAVFAASSGLLLEFTDDARKLRDTIDQLRAHPRISESGIMPCPRITPYQAYLILRNDSIAFQSAYDEATSCNGRPSGIPVPAGRVNPNDPAAETVRSQAEQTWEQARQASQVTLAAIRNAVAVLAGMRGSRTLLLASPGFLGGTLENEQDRIVSEALRAGVVINALDAKGLYAEAPGRPINELLHSAELPPSTFLFETASLGDRLETTDATMANLAQSTGGLFFHNNNDLDFGFYLSGVVPEFSYVLGFTPDGLTPDGKFHKVKVRLNVAQHYEIQARPGYFAPKTEPRLLTKAELNLDEEAGTSNTLTGVPADVKLEQGKLDTGEAVLWVVTHVDLTRLDFQRHEGRRVQKLAFIAVLFDAEGNFLTGKRGEMDLALKDATFARLAETGVNAKLYLPVTPGKYRLREVTQQGTNGAMSASTLSVEIR